MRSKFFHWLAIILVLEIGLLHIMTAQAEYEEAAYMGYLFAANYFCALTAAFGIYHRQFWGWMLGLFIAVGSLAGYAWSRTLGMPGMNVEEWLVPYGIVSMTVEGLFVALVLFRPWNMTEDVSATRKSRVGSISASVSGLVLVALIGTATYQWNQKVIRDFGHHVGSLQQVCGTPPMTFAELEEKYGVEISLAGTSMMGSIVDVRIKVVDPVKAHALLQNQAALLVNQNALILAPHMHSHNSTRLKVGKIFVMFFPTQQIIVPGSQVSLVFGSVRVEPVTVK
jgi:hypothetical protein